MWQSNFWIHLHGQIAQINSKFIDGFQASRNYVRFFFLLMDSLKTLKYLLYSKGRFRNPQILKNNSTRKYIEGKWFTFSLVSHIHDIRNINVRYIKVQLYIVIAVKCFTNVFLWVCTWYLACMLYIHCKCIFINKYCTSNPGMISIANFSGLYSDNHSCECIYRYLPVVKSSANPFTQLRNLNQRELMVCKLLSMIRMFLKKIDSDSSAICSLLT